MFFGNLDIINVHVILKPSVVFRDLDIVAAHLALAHQAIVGKGPVFEPVGTPPLPVLIVPLVPKLYGNLCKRKRISRRSYLLEAASASSNGATYPVLSKGKQLFAESVAMFLGPFLCQKLFYGIPSLEEVISVSPDRVGRISHLDGRGVPTRKS